MERTDLTIVLDKHVINQSDDGKANYLKVETRRSNTKSGFIPNTNIMDYIFSLPQVNIYEPIKLNRQKFEVLLEINNEHSK